MPRFVVRYGLPMGEASDKVLESGGVEVFTEIKGMTPFLPAANDVGGLTVLPGWELSGDSPLCFYPGISKEDEDVDGNPSPTPEDSAYYKQLVLRTFVEPSLSGTVIATVYSGTGSDSETGRFPSVYQELWGSQLDGNSGAVDNVSFGTVY